MKTTVKSEKLKIANRTAKLDEYGDYYISFKNKESVVRFYSNVRKMCSTTNFGLDPFEKNSYGLFKLNGIEYIINPPRHSNGDTNWYSYKNTNCSVKLRYDTLK